MSNRFHRISRLRLLVSVRNAGEAEAALAGGANWIDLKEPTRGALGAVDAVAAREVAACVAGRAPVSAAAGELMDWPQARARALLAVNGVSHLKLGLAGFRGSAWQDQWHAARKEIESAGKKLAAVIYADDVAASCPDRTEILQVAKSAPGGWILIDTYDKSSGTLVEHLSHLELQAVLASARACDHRTVVAGRLTLDSIRKLPLEYVDMIAVRGAACDGDRTGVVCQERVAELRALIKAIG
jgi:uncharacterized protein (UPF0264 family)